MIGVLVLRWSPPTRPDHGSCTKRQGLHQPYRLLLCLRLRTRPGL